MATALELCAQLGFLDTSHEGPSRGLPKVLLDDMKKYAKFRQFVRDAVLLADAYLYISNAGEKHWPSAEIPQWGFLAWGVDDGRIKELVTALFGLIMNSERADRVVIDLEGDDTMTSNEGNEQQAGDFQTLPAAERAQTATGDGQSHIGAIQVEDHTMTAHEGTKQPIEESQILLSAESEQRVVESMPSQLVASQIPGPITRLARKDPDLIWNLLDAGHTEPFPVIANTEAELMDVLDDWMITHLDRSPPGSRKVNTESLGRTFIKSLTFDTTLEEVRIEIRQILSTLMVYILKDADGSCMLVEPDKRKRGSARAYFAWLGGDLGFTENVIASSVRLNKPKIDIESARGRKSENDVIDNPQSCLGDADALNIRSKPRPSEVQPSSIRGRHIGRQTNSQRWRYNSPSASSPDKGRKRYWPPQYVSPSPSQQRKKLRLHPPRGRQYSPPALVSPAIDLDRTPLPEPGTSIVRASGREQGHVLGSYEPTGLSSKPFTVPVKDPYDASKASRPSGLRRSTRSQTTRAAGVRDTVFHFFLSDETLGAIPVPFRNYQTWDQFYDRALAACNLLGHKAGADAFVAVSVIIEGAEWPIVLPWGDRLAYMSMVESVADAYARKKGGLQVQVRCIKK